MKKRTRIGTWNVRTLYAVGKLEQAEREALRLKIDIIGISEARWSSFGEKRTPAGGKFLYSGKPDDQPHEYGVGFLLSKEASSSLMDWEPVNERIITARFKSKVRNITIVQAYAPTDSADLAEKERFYDGLQATMAKIKRQDIIIVMGDFNAVILILCAAAH
jgi:exonuclease III